MREIITLQLGSIANHVGTHFWNAQEEYFSLSGSNDATTDELDHSVLYRTGETSSGVTTYTPRTLIYDLKGGFGSMQKYNKLFNSSDDGGSTWDQGINRIDRSVSKSQYQYELDRMESENDPNISLDVLQSLDSTVNNWSDYNRIYYHPKSINPIVTHQMDNEITPFDNYTIGRQAYQENEKEMDIFEDNFRFFVEECDNLQGFQILTDVDDAFGGFTEGLLNNIRDEFQKTPIMTYGLSDSHAQYRTDRHKQKIMLNRAFGMARLSELSSIYVPVYTPTLIAAQRCGLSPHYLQFNDMSRYHTSAIIAAAIETNSLPYRIKKNPITLADTVSKLNWVRSTRLASLAVSVPLPISKSGYIETLENFNKLRPTLSLLDRVPPSTETVDVYGETIVTRGLPYNMHGQSEYLQKLYADLKDENDPLSTRFNLAVPLPLPDSYPHIFTSRIDQDGLVTTQPNTTGESPKSVPIFGRLQSGSELKYTIDQQLKQLDKIVFADFYEYAQGESGLSREDFLEMKEALITLSDVYNTEDDSMMM